MQSLSGGIAPDNVLSLPFDGSTGTGILWLVNSDIAEDFVTNSAVSWAPIWKFDGSGHGEQPGPKFLPLPSSVLPYASAEDTTETVLVRVSCATSDSPAEIVRFFGHPRSIVYDVVARYNASEESQEVSANMARKTQSQERLLRTAMERAQVLILEDQDYLRYSQTVVKPRMVTVASGMPHLFQQDVAVAHTTT